MHPLFFLLYYNNQSIWSMTARSASPTLLKRIFDEGTGRELINTLIGEINGRKTILYRTETKAYIKMQEGEIEDIASTVNERKKSIDPSVCIIQVTTNNIITLIFTEK